MGWVVVKFMPKIFLIPILISTLTLAACGGDNATLDPTSELSQAESDATIGKLNNERATVTIPVAEIGGELSQDCSINIAVNSTARHTDLNCATYYVDAQGEIIFVLPNLFSGDVIEVVIVNDATTYIYTVTVSDAAETTATMTSQGDSDSGDDTPTAEEPFYSPDGDDVDYITITAVDENGSVTLMFPYDVIWDDADEDEIVASFYSFCNDDTEYDFTYADVLEQKDADGNVTVSFSNCAEGDSVSYYLALSISTIEGDDVEVSLDEDQKIVIPEVTHTSMSND